MTERSVDTDLRNLKQHLLEMGGNVERAIEHATEALVLRDIDRLAKVHEIERKINRAHIDVDSECVRLLALQQPLAADLRLVVAVLKINTDLERMGDQAVNIAYNSERYLKGAPLKPLIDLPKMSEDVRRMVRESLDAFVKGSEPLAREVLQYDDAVDALKNKIFSEVLDHIKADPTHIDQGLTLILIARNLERIGDHATNIAEDVIFALTGDDIRHTGRPESLPKILPK